MLLKNRHVTKGARGDALFFSYPAVYFIHFSEHLSGSLTEDNSKSSAGGVHVSLLGAISESWFNETEFFKPEMSDILQM